MDAIDGSFLYDHLLIFIYNFPFCGFFWMEKTSNEINEPTAIRLQNLLKKPPECETLIITKNWAIAKWMLKIFSFSLCWLLLVWWEKLFPLGKGFIEKTERESYIDNCVHQFFLKNPGEAWRIQFFFISCLITETET